MINIFALMLLAVMVLLDVILAFYVLPRNWKELRRPTDQYIVMRYTMLTITLSMILFTLIPIAYQTTRINLPVTESVDLFRALSSTSFVLLILSFMIGWVVIHIASDILIRKDKRKK